MSIVTKRSRPFVSLGKNLLVLLLASAFFAGLLELASAWVYSSTHKRPFDRKRLQGRLLGNRTDGAPVDEEEAVLEEELGKLKDVQVPDQSVIIHPYFGFVVDPESPGINDYGFFEESPMTEPSSDTVVVAIFGGSVADQVFYMARDALIERLQTRGPFRNRKIRVVSTALGGYKQPQQLLILSYFLAMGAHYDMVINLDGFNEIDGPQENVIDGVNPFYPYRWKFHARQALDPTATALAGRIDIVRENRRRLRELFGRWPLRDSAFFLTFWDALDRGERAALRGYTEELLDRVSGGKLPPRVRGPAVEFADQDEFYAAMADVWMRSSAEMDRLCRRLGIEYFHFLQPNQYLPDSKPLTEEEREIAYDPEFSGVERVPAGYSYLVDRGAELQLMGVNFVDLTMVFANDDRTLYSDTCCHVNELGAEILATAIADAMIERFG